MRVAPPSRLTDDFDAFVSDEASIAASEICSPNSVEWAGAAARFAESDDFRSRLLPHFLAIQGFSTTEHNGATWPTFSPLRGKVFHVGSMDPSAKGATHNAMSHEGNGLSISLHPAEWRQIAKLGGQPTWELLREGSRFLDAHCLTSAQRDTMHSWALDHGYIEMAPAIQASYFDEELGATFSSLHDVSTAEGRRLATQLSEDLADAEMPQMAQVLAERATSAMNERAGFAVPLGNASDIALTFFVEDVLHASHGLDGVWWEDDFAPYALSAPRGTIHAHALQEWSAAQARDNTVDRPRFG